MNKPFLHILHVFDGFRLGGTELRTCRIINALGSKYRHTICSINGNFDALIHIERLSEVFIFDAKYSSLPLFLQWRKIYSSLKKIQPDLMIGYAWGAIDWVIVNSLFRICPSIHAAEGFDNSETLREKHHRKLLRRIFYNRCELVVTCSKVLKNIATKNWKIKSEKVILIPNGVNISRFSFIDDTEFRACEQIRIGIVASLIKLKNHAHLIKCFGKLSNNISAKLYIIGDGPEIKNLIDLCERLNLKKRVVFMGHVNDPSSVLKMLDIFCLSSDVEQMPIAVLEAMAVGLPIVSTNVGDIKDMVSYENKKFIVKKSNEYDYVKAIETLIKNKNMRRRIGIENRNRCRVIYSEHVMLERYETLFKTFQVKNSFNKKKTSVPICR